MRANFAAKYFHIALAVALEVRAFPNVYAYRLFVEVGALGVYATHIYAKLQKLCEKIYKIARDG